MNNNFVKIRIFFFSKYFLILILSLVEYRFMHFFFLNVVEISNIFDRIGSINNKTDTVSTMKAIGKIYLSMYIDRRISLSNATIFYFARKSGVKSWEHQFSSNHLWFNAFSLFACRAIRVYRFRKFYILIYSFFFSFFFEKFNRSRRVRILYNVRKS